MKNNTRNSFCTRGKEPTEKFTKFVPFGQERREIPALHDQFHQIHWLALQTENRRQNSVPFRISYVSRKSQILSLASLFLPILT